MIIDALDGRVPNAIAHPNRQALLQSEDIRGFEPVGLAYFDMAALPPLPREAVEPGPRSDQAIRLSLGLSGRHASLDRGRGRAGAADGHPGVVRSADVRCGTCRRFRSGVAGFTVVSLEEPGSAQRFASRSPRSRNFRDRMTWAARTRSMSSSRRCSEFRCTTSSSPTWDTVHALQRRHPDQCAVTHPRELGTGLVPRPKMALVAEVKNRDLLAKSLEKMIDRANAALRDMPKAAELGSRSARSSD